MPIAKKKLAKNDGSGNPSKELPEDGRLKDFLEQSFYMDGNISEELEEDFDDNDIHLLEDSNDLQEEGRLEEFFYPNFHTNEHIADELEEEKEHGVSEQPKRAFNLISLLKDEIKSLPKDKQDQARLSIDRLENIFKQESTVKPDISGIPPWGGKKKDGPAIEWLDHHYGDYLATFRAEENLIYRQDILAHDPKLVDGVQRESYKSSKKSRDYIPTRTDKVDTRGAELGIDNSPELRSTVNTLIRRTYRHS